MMRYIGLLLLFILTFLKAVAQEDNTKVAVEVNPSPDTASIFYSHLNDRWPGEKIIRLNDSILTGFQFYIPTEGETLLTALTGNAGLAYHSMVFDIPQYSGFKYTPFDFIAYKWINRNIRYFQTTGPYTNLFYSTGAGKEQVFNITHSQNIVGGLTLGLDLQIINSLGLYERQKSDNVSFAGTAQFVSKNEHYVVLGNYHNSRLRWRENGGISNLQLFKENVETDRKRIPIYLLNADNQLKESGVMVRQFYYFGKARNNPVSDSLKSDTIGPKKLHRYYDPTRSNFLKHTFSYSRNSNLYKDANPKSGYYDRILIDSVKTYDSVYYHEISNDLAIEAGVGRAKGSSKALLVRVGVEHIAGLYKNDTIQKTFNRLTPYAYLSANAFGYAKVEGMIWTTQGSPFNGDKGVEGILTLPGYDNTDKWGNLKVSAALNIEQPFYFFQYHYSNHFSWENAFGQQTTLSLKAKYDYKYLKAGFNAYNLNDYVYLDHNSIPRKEEGAVSVTQIWANTNFKWRYLETQIFGVLQNSTKPDVISLPGFAGRMTISYTRPLFKRALHFQAGVSGMFNSPFHEYEYMPALRSFHTQDHTTTGGYLFIDAFINLRVKRARMFLLMKHVNSGWMYYEYIMIPGYPMPDRGLRFGISWAFYD